MITVNNITCDCTRPGYCPHFQKQTDLESHKRIWEIIQGVNIDPATRAAYLAKWAGEITAKGGEPDTPPKTFRQVRQETTPCNCQQQGNRTVR